LLIFPRTVTLRMTELSTLKAFDVRIVHNQSISFCPYCII
jgi:hypothetical protein